MRGAKFVKQLETALPAWVERGLLSARGVEDILAFERERSSGGIPYLTVALSILGVLLLGSGIISFFAANWDWLPKIAKLAILYGGMWGAYAVAGWLLGRGAVLYLLQVYFLSYLALYLVGMLLERGKDTAEFAGLVRRHAGTAAIATLLMLTFPDLHRGRDWWPQGSAVLPAHSWLWATTTVVAFAAVLALAWTHRKSSRESSRPAYLDWGWALLAAIGALIFINLFARGDYPQFIAILFNFVFFGALLWLIYAGVAAHDRALVNTAFAFFALGILARYLDTFWSLLGRSYFFMGGGLILIVAGIILERSRRRITRGIGEGAT